MKNHYHFPGFLPKDHCEKLIQRAKASRLFEQDSTLNSEGVQISDYRTSQSIGLVDRTAEHLLSDSFELEKNSLEMPRLISYKEGMEFKPHYDFHVEGMDGYDENIKHGQRSLSLILYLNDNYDGGALNFDKLDDTIHTSEGDLVIIVNQFPDQSLNWDSSHASLPVTKGTKYILQINYKGSYDPSRLENFVNQPAF